MANSKIVNGDIAEFGRYPYMASFINGNTNLGHFCGGTLIAPRVVLTAAHCFEGGLDPTIVSLGCTDLTDLKGGDCEVRNIQSVTLHPDYDLSLSVSGGNDVAIIILDQDSTQTPIQIAAPGFTFTDEPTLELGWGNELPIYGAFIGGTVLREAESNLISNEDCDAQYDFPFGVLYGVEDVDTIDDTMICSNGNSEGACQGDSGGPLLIPCEGTEADLQVGITSFGLGCAKQGIPGVFARTFTQSAFDFITSQVNSVGQSFSFRNSLDGFCADAPIPDQGVPTPFPTFVDGWVCDAFSFAGQDGCHCNCGIPDPDCEFDRITIIGCDEGEICSSDGLCVPGEPDTLDGVPDEWQCSPFFFNTNDGCDCNCGVFDPDCLLTPNNVFGCEENEVCALDGTCVPSDENVTVVVPPEWICDPELFGTNDGCDCNCGAFDPDCLLTPAVLFGCSNGETCNSDGICEAIPANWTCAFTFFATNDGCDCNCGAFDPDCLLTPDRVFGCGAGQTCDSEGLCFGDILSDDDTDNEDDTVFGLDENTVIIVGAVAAVAIILFAGLGVVLCKARSNKSKQVDALEPKSKP